MGEKVTVARAELAELVGLPADASDATLNAAIERLVAQADAAKEAERQAAENGAHADEDGRTIAAALAEGRIAPQSSGEWFKALQRNREGTKRVLASLAPVRLDMARPADGPDPVAQAVHDRVMASLGIRDRRSVQASAKPAPTMSAPPSLSAVLNPAVLPEGRPIRVGGTDPSTWTKEQQDNAMLYRLGGRFAAGAAARGIPPPPPGPVYYTNSPGGQCPTYVPHDDGTGHWEPPTGRVVM